MGAKSRKWWLAGLALLVIGFLLYHFRSVFDLSQFSGARLWAAIRGANYWYLLLSVVAIYVCYAVRALRWQRFQAHVGPAKFWNIYAMNLAGFSALFLLGRAAEPVRPLLISRKDKIPLADTFGIYALERILDAASTAILAAIGLLVFESSGRFSGEATGQVFEKAARTAGITFSVAAIVAVSGLIYLRFHGAGVLERRSQAWLAQGGWRAAVARILLGFSRGAQTIRTWGDLVSAIVLSFVHWWLVVAIYWMIAHAFGGKIGTLSFTDSMLVLVFTMVGSAVQLPGVGGGAQVLCAYAFAHLFGVPQETAVAAALVLWIITFASCSLAGVPILLREGWSLGELRKMREHEGDQLNVEMANQELSVKHGEVSGK
jgi:uncharacterized protein (TIRG00374 family)